MTGTITKIDPEKENLRGIKFIRVYFDIDGKWAKTDLCQRYDNFRHWKSVLQVGAVLEGLQMRNDTTVDADSKVWMAKCKLNL